MKNAGRKFHAAYIPQKGIVLVVFLISSEVHIWLSCTISETYAIKSQFKDRATAERFWIYIPRFFSNAFLCWRYACSMYFSIFSVLQFANSCKFFHGNMDTCKDLKLAIWNGCVSLSYLLQILQYSSSLIFKGFLTLLKFRPHSFNKETSKDLGCIYLGRTALNIFQTFFFVYEVFLQEE